MFMMRNTARCFVPLEAFPEVALHHEGKFSEGSWAVNSGYLWITLVYNVTYSWALFSLLLLALPLKVLHLYRVLAVLPVLQT
jgi:hypothetical protein